MQDFEVLYWNFDFVTGTPFSFGKDVEIVFSDYFNAAGRIQLNIKANRRA